MNAHVLSQAAQLSDQDLLARVKDLAHREREATTALIAHLAVLDERRLYLAEGCSSMFTYCTQVLHLSEYAAYSRIEAARAARTFPRILELLAQGAVNLTTVGLLAPHLTAENHAALLDEARHKSKRQVEEFVARLRPQPPVPATVRRLPAPTHASATLTTGDHATVSVLSGGSLGVPGAPEAPLVPLPVPASLPPARRPVIEPLAPYQYRVQFTADEGTYQQLRQAQDLLRHQIPDGDAGTVIGLALTALLKDLAKQKYAATEHPRDRQGQHNEEHNGPISHSRHIPAGIKRKVWLRDGGQCAFLAPNGRRCTERAFLEFHHLVSYSAGGEATVENIELRCRAHNAYESELAFGQGMCQKVSLAPLAARESPRDITLDMRSGPEVARRNHCAGP